MVDRDAVRRGYDALADVYAAERVEDDEGVVLFERLLDSLPAAPAVLDAGCGNGRPVLVRAAERGTACGLDISGEQLRRAATNVPRAALAQGELTALPFAAGSFDAVVALWSVIHVPEGEHPAVFDEFRRILRPGGRVLVSEGPETWTGRNDDWLDSGVGMAWHLAGADRTREQLRDAGFTIDDRWTVSDSLSSDRDETEEPWTVFAATLER